VDIDDTLTDVPERIHQLQKKPKASKATEEWAKIGDQIQK
jgi:hypothetical protein